MGNFESVPSETGKKTKSPIGIASTQRQPGGGRWQGEPGQERNGNVSTHR